MAADSQVFTLIARRPILYASVPFFLFSGSIPVIWRQSENLRCAVFPLRSKSPKTRKGALSTCPVALATKTIECKYFQTGLGRARPTAAFCSRISNQDWPFLFVRLFPDAFSPFLSSSKYQSRECIKLAEQRRRFAFRRK